MIIESHLATDSNILPDTTMVMAFRYRGNVQKIEGEHLPAAVVSGLRRSHRLLHYSKDTANLLVVFKEGGITAFSGIPAHELFGLTIRTENLFSSTKLNVILEKISEAKTNTQRITHMEAFLQAHLSINKPDLLIGKAIQQIKQQNGILKIKDLAASLHISQDPFEKRFRSQVGATPKQYTSIIRLRSLINNFSSYSSFTEASYEAGYFDQSHFIKDFRVFTGQTPKDFFTSSLYW
jgi:AraC-like DNA-binding protein